MAERRSKQELRQERSKRAASGLKKSYVDEDVLTLARRRVAELYDRFDTVSVQFSGGKDSTVCLQLCAEEAERRGARMHVVHLDEECVPYQTEAYVRRTMEEMRRRFGDRSVFRWLCLPVQHRNACSAREPYWYPWDPERRELWVRPVPAEAETVERHPKLRRGMSWPQYAGYVYDPVTDGTVAQVLGIRGDESMTRLHAVTQRREDNWLQRVGGSAEAGHPFKWQRKAYPIYDWTTQDVWTAPARFGWDYNEAYDLFEMAGIPHKAQRLAPPYGEEPMGQLWMWQECFPEIWDGMCRRVEGAATAARYSRTGLYNFGERPVRDERSWQERIAEEIAKWPDQYREKVKEQTRFYITYHYAATNDPLLDVPHPATGVSWPFIFTVAQRGDLKERMRPRLLAERRSNRAQRYPEEFEKWKQRRSVRSPA